MASLQFIVVGIPGQSETFQKISVTPADWANYFGISYLILKAYSLAKPIKDLSIEIERVANEIISQVLSSSSLDTEHRKSIECFKAILDYLVSVEDYTTTPNYVSQYISNSMYFHHILISGYHFANHIAAGNGDDLVNILATDPSKLLQYLTIKFPIYINLIWPDSSLLISNPSNIPGIQLSFYYENDGNSKLIYSPLLKSGEDSIKFSPNNPSEYFKAFCYNFQVKPSDSKGMSLSIFSSNFPKLLNLVTVMVKKLALNKLYDKDLDDALKGALKEMPDLRNVPGIQNIYSQKKFVCDRHPHSGFLETLCGFEHCRDCIFLRIKDEIEKGLRINVYCPCKSEISPKMIAEIRKSNDFKMFLKNN
jgi:hypothetical protein